MECSTYLFGKRFRNRLFVGGLPLSINAEQLASYFSNFGCVIEAKVINDENNLPKGYGFVTFTSEDEVRKVIDMGTLFLGNKKLNLGPAVKKQIPQVVDNPELVVVSTQMKGEFYYPATMQYPTIPPQVQSFPTYYPAHAYHMPIIPEQQVAYSYQPYNFVQYGEQPSPPMCHQVPPSINHVPTKKRLVPPRFRRSRRAREN